MGATQISRSGVMAQPTAVAWSPEELNPTAWIDVSKITELSDDENIASMVDQATESVWINGTGQTLAYKTNIWNDLPVMRFDGLGARMISPSVIVVKHIFIVAAYDLATFPAFEGLVTADTISILLQGISGASRFNNYSANLVYHKDGVSFPLTNMAAPMSGAPSVISLSDSVGFTRKLQVGRDRNTTSGDGRYWDGDVAELLAFSSVLSATDRQLVEAYLKAKWATP